MTYPEGLAARYRRNGVWTDQPIGARLHQVAARFPDREAVIAAEGTMTFAELDRRTDQIAAGLLGLGLRRRDPVLFQSTNRLETVLSWYGCLKAGLIPVATLAAHRMHEIGHISRKVGAVAHIVEAGLPSFDLVDFAKEHADNHPTMRHIITIGDRGGDPSITELDELGRDHSEASARVIVEQIESEIGSEDVAVFQLSGGTTGVPKVIPRLHAEYWDNARLYAERLGWDEHSRVAHLGPIVHNAGITAAMHAAHSVGACLVLATPEPASAFEVIIRAEVTEVIFGQSMFRELTKDEFSLARTSLKRVILSGTKVSPELFEHVDAETGRWAGQLFGMGEGLFVVTPLDAPGLARQTTVGTPISSDDEVKILEPGTEKPVSDGSVGELCCRGPYTIRGYFDADEHNKVAFTSEGFYRTGDLAAVTTIDGVRYLSIEGRIKDLINRGGEKINAEEVELLLLEHPGIANAAVVAMPDQRLGEKTCAYLVAGAQPLSLSEVQDHLLTLGVAKFKWPERLEWVAEFPRTNVGKTDKKRLRSEIAAKLTAEVETRRAAV
ncbi:(2,3-dihydroxybenzoyl)adenylate synthase [Rhodococcus sp. ACT016]|uniref:(2,3-dihydroxybenzoyl)adenylate synthase n=1 Tax=Rhodococcus sp. ACT016 TaxID=3134808 RepID=UPI003D2B457B